MKKLFTFFASVLSLGAFAQSSITAYKLSNNYMVTATITNGSNLQLYTSTGSIEDTKFKFKNNSASTQTYNISRSFVAQTPALFTDGSSSTPNSYFCFGQTCFGSNVAVAPPSDYTILNAGDDSQTGGQPASFYLAEGSSIGYYVVHYKIFNVNNPNDTLGFNAIYNSADVGIRSNSNSLAGLSDLYPNPNPGAVVSFDLAKDDELKFQVYNSLGSLVYSAPKQKYAAGRNKLSFESAGLSNGVYFVTVTGNTGKTTKRLVVNK